MRPVNSIYMMLLTLECLTPVDLYDLDTSRQERLDILELVEKVGGVLKPGKNEPNRQKNTKDEYCLKAEVLADLYSVLDCGLAPSICGAEITYNDLSRPISAIYTCIPGAMKVSGSGNSLCTINGNWTKPSLICTKLSFFPRMTNKTQAAKTCNEVGMNLLNIRQKEEVPIINNFLSQKARSASVWTGLEFDLMVGMLLWPDDRQFSKEDSFDLGEPARITIQKCFIKAGKDWKLKTDRCRSYHLIVCSC